MANINSWREAFEVLTQKIVNELENNASFQTPEGIEIASKLSEIFKVVNSEING